MITPVVRISKLFKELDQKLPEGTLVLKIQDNIKALQESHSFLQKENKKYKFMNAVLKDQLEKQKRLHTNVSTKTKDEEVLELETMYGKIKDERDMLYLQLECARKEVYRLQSKLFSNVETCY